MVVCSKLLGSIAKVRFEDAKTVKLEDGRMVRFLASYLHKWLQAPRFTASGFCGTPSIVGSCRCSGGFRVEGRRVTVIKVRVLVFLCLTDSFRV